MLVAEHDSRAPALFHAIVLAQPGGDEACLDVLGGCADIGDALGVGTQVTVDVVVGDVELVGELAEVLADVVARLVALHVVVVEVPIELGLALAHETGAKGLLGFLHHVETHEEIDIVGEVEMVV